MRRSLVLLLVAVAASSVGCVTSKRDDVASAGKAPVVAEPRASADARAEALLSEAGILAPAPVEVGALYPVVEGACARATPYAVGKSPVLVITRDAWIMSDVPRALHRMGGPTYDRLSGTMHENSIGLVGGIDEAHAWLQIRTSSGRGEDLSAIYFHFPQWHFLETPHGGQSQYGITHVIPQADGGIWAYGLHGMYLDLSRDKAGLDGPDAYNRYFAWSVAGESLAINLPGGDMRDAVRMASGELVAAGWSKQGEAQLRRWSPAKKVDDLVVPGPMGQQTSSPELGVGTARAVLLPSRQKHAFYTYLSDKLQPSKLNARLADVGSWLVTSSDDLMVTTAAGALFIETKDGVVTEEKLPEAGRLAGEPTLPWLMATSGALYRRAGSEWAKMTLPESPWAAETHPPARVEWVKTVAGETWVSTVRTDLGFGLKKPGEVRTLYASKARPAPVRCGAPFGTEATLAAFPPRATASCDKLIVVVASEKEGDKPASYPKLGAALKGDAALGDTLSFVVFGPEKTPVLGIAAPSPEIAAALVKKLAKVASHAPEIVCGAADERRRLDLDVKTGVFSPRP
jgi:hypothetical protein